MGTVINKDDTLNRLHTNLHLYSGWTGELAYWSLLKFHLPKNTIDIDLFVYGRKEKKISGWSSSVASSYNKSASNLR